MVEAVGPVQGASYLDLGTSTGLYSRALLAAGASRVYALDFSPAMLGQAIRKSAGVRGFIPLLASAQSLPLVDACLEGVVIGGSWNEFADLPLVAAEIARVLRPGGKLWLMFSQSQGLLGRVLKATGLHFPDLQETQQLLQSQGLTTRGWQERQVAFVVGCKALTGEGHRDLG